MISAISSAAFEHLSETWDNGKIELQEEFKVLLLDRKNSCLGIMQVSSGGITACMVDLRLAFAAALKARATGLILAHNYPSGNKTFRDNDKDLTRKFAEAEQVLDISISDHLILTAVGYKSIADEGQIPSMSKYCPS